MMKRQQRKQAAYEKRLKKRLDSVPWDTSEIIVHPQLLTFQNYRIEISGDSVIQDFYLCPFDKFPTISIYHKGVRVKSGDSFRSTHIYNSFVIGFGYGKNQIFKRCQSLSHDMQYPKVSCDEGYASFSAALGITQPFVTVNIN